MPYALAPKSRPRVSGLDQHPTYSLPSPSQVEPSNIVHALCSDGADAFADEEYASNASLSSGNGLTDRPTPATIRVAVAFVVSPLRRRAVPVYPTLTTVPHQNMMVALRRRYFAVLAVVEFLQRKIAERG